LGENFSLPYKNKKEVIIEFIKNIENNIKKLQGPTQDMVRNRAIPIVHKYISSILPRNSISLKLHDLTNSSDQFLTNNLDLILTKADKGNLTVALDKSDYLNKINLMLLDSNTYSKIGKKPINKMVNNLKNLLEDEKSRIISLFLRTEKFIVATECCPEPTVSQRYINRIALLESLFLP